jgi:hypothetical protein
MGTELAIPENFLDDPAATIVGLQRLMAFITYPDDDAKRHNLVSLRNAEFLNSASRRTPEGATEEEREWRGFLRDRALNTLAPQLDVPNDPVSFVFDNMEMLAALKQEQRQRLKLLFTMNYLVSALLRLRHFRPDEPASLRKAYWLADAMGLGNSTSLKRVWKMYRGIAHLSVPLVQMIRKQPPLSDGFDAALFLGMARQVQGLLLSLTTDHHQNKQLITEDDLLWLVPESWSLSQITFSYVDFSTKEQRVLSGYRAD